MERKYFEIKDNAPTSDVIDLSTRRSGMDAFMGYNDMVRTIRTKVSNTLKSTTLY